LEVSEAIQARKSVRSFDSKPVPEDVLTRVLEAGRFAPSAKNYQPWHFVVVKDQKKREVLSEGKYAKFLKDTPMVIVGCGDQEASEKWCVVDCSIALQQMVIAATGEGLGTCWIGSFYEDRVRELLKIPPRYKIVAMLAVGYPKGRFEPASKLLGTRNRKKLDEITSFEEFGKGKVTE